MTYAETTRRRRARAQNKDENNKTVLSGSGDEVLDEETTASKAAIDGGWNTGQSIQMLKRKTTTCRENDSSYTIQRVCGIRR
jgi:hypothetical protein